jgi:hypothetical protein
LLLVTLPCSPPKRAAAKPAAVDGRAQAQTTTAVAAATTVVALAFMRS